VQAVQRLLCQYNRYIHLKLEDDDSLLTKCMTGYAGNLDEVKYKSLEEQVGIWQREIDAGTEKEREKASLEKMENKPTRWEFCLALDRPELYRSYLDKPISRIFTGKCEKKHWHMQGFDSETYPVRRDAGSPLYWKPILSSSVSR